MTEPPYLKPVWQEVLPIELRTMMGEQRWEPVTIGRSGMHVFHVSGGYVKIARSGGDLRAERARITWLQGKLPVPQVYYYGDDGSFEYLYLSEIPGIMACDPVFKADLPSLIALLAEALHMVHAVSIETCPFQWPLQLRLEEIQHKVFHERIDEERFAARHQGLSPQVWYRQLERMQPATDDLVFIHSDFSLPNVIIDRQRMRINGLIDLGCAGIADRHEDLVAACWSLGYNFDTSWIPALLATYGSEYVDQEKLAFYQWFDDLSSYM